MNEKESIVAKQETLKIPALHCASCANTVARVLGPLPSVKVTQTDLEAKLVHIQFDESEVGYFPED